MWHYTDSSPPWRCFQRADWIRTSWDDCENQEGASGCKYGATKGQQQYWCGKQGGQRGWRAAITLTKGTDQFVMVECIPEHWLLPGQGSFFSNRIWFSLFCCFFFLSSLFYCFASCKWKTKRGWQSLWDTHSRHSRTGFGVHCDLQPPH